MKEKIENLGKVSVTIEEDYWDIKKPYDKLTVVEREGTGTTFISRKPVPPGTSILNRKYWIKFSKWSDIPYEITQKFGDSEELAISQKTLTNKFDDVETEIREGDESLDRRLRVVEVHERIMIDGGELEVATGYDLEHPESPRQEAAVPTVRAILDASDDEPHLNSTKRFINSDNLAKMYGYYLDNPEFIYLLLDSEYRIIFGVKTNSDVVFGIGVPTQIKDYIEKRIEDIIAFLDDLEKGDKTLQDLLDEKVDKEEGKSLIDEEYAEGVHYIENPEFVEVKLDQDDRILEAIMLDGTKLLPAGYEVDGNVVKTISNPEYLAAWLDNADHILFALKADGDVIFGCGVPSQIKEHVSELIEMFHYEDNPEFIDVKLDAKGKILEGIKNDGTKIIGGNLEVLGSLDINGITYSVVSNLEWLKAVVDSENKIICGIKADGTFCVVDIDFLDSSNKIKEVLNHFNVIDNPEFLSVELDENEKVLGGRRTDGTKFENVGLSTPNVSIDGHTIENIEDLEGRSEITTDSDGKIISYRDSDGVKHEDAGIETIHLKLTEKGLSDLEKDLKEHGFSSGQGDWSDAKELHIAEPYCARVNFTGIDNIPQSKGVNLHGYMQFWDMNGNYFKKEVIMNAQGASSMLHPKKNIAIDICNNNGWNDNDTFKIKIGSWVSQDSFHLKAYYADAFKGIGAIGYKLYNSILKSRGEFNDYVWKRALIDLDSITPTNPGTTSISNQCNTGARCFPDGFPCIVFLNGEFYGIYSWQLKKHRDNYHMKKNNAKHIHLDCDALNDENFFDGNINWSAFEIRNPKSLKLIDGSDYDGDNPAEITGDSTVSEISAKVKQYIVSFSQVKLELKNLYDVYIADRTEEHLNTFKQKFEEYFDIENIMDYIIFSDVARNWDGLWGKNWQWITYDGKKWYVCAYDLDCIFGGWWDTQNTIVEPSTTHGSGMFFFNYLFEFYNDRTEKRYKELRDRKIIDADNIINITENWLNRIGDKDVFEKEWEKWSDFIRQDSIHRLYKWLLQQIDNMDILYNYN